MVDKLSKPVNLLKYFRVLISILNPFSCHAASNLKMATMYRPVPRMTLSSARYRLPRGLAGKSVYLYWFFRICLFALCLVAIYHLNTYQQRSKISPELQHLRSLKTLPVSSECKIPRPDPWDPMVIPYYSRPDPLDCRPIQAQAVVFKDGIVHFNKSLLGDSQCFITPFWHNQGISDFEFIYGNQSKIDFNRTGLSFPVRHEFFEIRCTVNGVFSIRDVFAKNFVQIIPTNMTRKLPEALPRPIEESSFERPSVVMIGLDSMSRQNFIRQLPKTHARMGRMGFTDMLGNVKIHDNTYGNLVAVLMGKRGVSTKEFQAEIDENWDIAYDDFEMVWKNFSRNGYATLFAEDRPDIATFNYMRQLCGFLNQPVNHYMRPFWLATYWSIASRRSKPYCYDAKPMHRVHLDYLEEYIKAYMNQRHFAFWWYQDASHDYLNLIGMMDDDLDSFLKRNEQRMENTIVIIFSDHGHRYDKIRETINGRLEARLPYLSIRLPLSIKEQFPFLEKQLNQNVNRMTTPFDLHETINDIAWGTFSDPKKLSLLFENKSTGPRRPRGFSLFGPIPKNRTCFEAGIPEDYCPCFNEKEIGVEEAGKPAQVLLSRINDILANAPEVEKSEFSNNQEFFCAPMAIEKILYASIRLPAEKLVIDPQTGNQIAATGIQVQYRVVFLVKAPIGAIIEGIAVKDFSSNAWFTTNEFERNNAYGNNSLCVNDPVLKKLCHCMKPSSKMAQTSQPE